MTRDDSLGARLNSFRQRNPVLASLLFAAVVISAVITIGSAVGGVVTWINESVRWRSIEYRKLDALKAGISVQKFEETLGTPILGRAVLKGRFTENVFRGRDYWVQAISDADGTVLLYAVTSCDEGFNPTFAVPKYGPAPGGGTRLVDQSLTLQASRFANLADAGPIRYYFGGATASRLYYEQFGGGNPTNYQTFYAGLNDACPPKLETLIDKQGLELPDYEEPGGGLDFSGDAQTAPQDVKRFLVDFRKLANVNTYGESFLGWSLSERDLVEVEEGSVRLEEWELPFQLGVDRVAIRHLQSPELGVD